MLTGRLGTRSSLPCCTLPSSTVLPLSLKHMAATRRCTNVFTNFRKFSPFIFQGHSTIFRMDPIFLFPRIPNFPGPPNFRVPPSLGPIPLPPRTAPPPGPLPLPQKKIFCKIPMKKKNPYKICMKSLMKISKMIKIPAVCWPWFGRTRQLGGINVLSVWCRAELVLSIFPNFPRN